MNYILSDEINSGKSARILAVAKKLISERKVVSGFITPAHMEAGEKVGHDFILIDKNKFSKPIPFTRLHPFKNSFQWRKFHFNNRAFDIAEKMGLGCDIFILDEIGPLELEDKMGFYSTLLTAIKTAPSTITVIREEIKEKFCADILSGNCLPLPAKWLKRLTCRPFQLKR